MQTLFATCLLVLVARSAAQCDNAGYNQCLAQYNSTRCLSYEFFEGDALCACQAQHGVCANMYNCTPSCITTMAASNCGAEWCSVIDVTDPIRLTTVYRFSQTITIEVLRNLLLTILSPVVRGEWLDVSDVLDVSVPTPPPTLSPGTTPSQIDDMCAMEVFKSDCEQNTHGYCTWAGSSCVGNGKQVPSPPSTPDPSVPVPTPVNSDDVRVTLCAHSAQAGLCTTNLCVMSNGKCVPDPSYPVYSVSRYCSSIPEKNCPFIYDLCEWSNGRCVVNTKPPGEDVRPIMCSSGSLCSNTGNTYCIMVNGECVANPDGPSVSANMLCHINTNFQESCTSLSFCTWTGDTCIAASTGHRLAEILEGGPWEVEVHITLQRNTTINTGLPSALAQQMDNAVSSVTGAVVHKATIVETEGQGEVNDGDDDGLSAGGIVGIVIGSVIVLALVCLIISLVVIKKKAGVAPPVDHEPAGEEPKAVGTDGTKQVVDNEEPKATDTVEDKSDV